MSEETREVEIPDCYDVPNRRGWTCFHCDDTFTTYREARDHFGFERSDEPACRIKAGAERGLLGALRKAEQDLADAWALIHSESSEVQRAYYSQASRHQQQLQTAEELGYERGLRDAGLLPAGVASGE